MKEPNVPVPSMKPGDPAKDFTLKDQDDHPFRLGEQRKRTLLAFHPLAWTNFCTGHMQSLENNYDKLASLNTEAFGISVDSVPCKKAWADDIGISSTRLLSDFWPHGGVAEIYGVFNQEEGKARRAHIIIDESMTVRFVKVYPTLSLPDIEEVISFLETI
jgi:peroxiredoxin